MQRMSKQNQPVLWTLGGLALGVLATYLMDPDRGKTRRAKIRNQVTHAGAKARKTIDSQSHNLANHARGMVHEAKSSVRGFKRRWKGDVVMQASQVKEEMPRIERIINNADQLCQMSDNVPDELRECMSELERESEAVTKMLSDEQNEQRIFDSVAHLEELGDRAKKACNQAGTIDDKVAQAVQEAHDALSDLKHRLH